MPPSSQFDGGGLPSGRDGEAASELLLTASRDADLRLWSYRAPRRSSSEEGFAHVGRFGRDGWWIEDESSHCKPPRVAAQEPAAPEPEP